MDMKLFKFTIKDKTYLNVFNTWADFGKFLDSQDIAEVSAVAYKLPYEVPGAVKQAEPVQEDFELKGF